MFLYVCPLSSEKYQKRNFYQWVFKHNFSQTDSFNKLSQTQITLLLLFPNNSKMKTVKNGNS